MKHKRLIIVLVACAIFGVLMAGAAINLGLPEGTKPMPGDLQTTGNRSLMKINQLLYEAQTDITKPLGVQDVIGVLYLTAISNLLSGGITTTTTFGNQSTNSIGLTDQSTNSIRVTGIGDQSTNSIGISGIGNQSTNSIKVAAGTNSVGGFTLITNLTIPGYLTGLDANDSMVTNGIEVANVCRSSGGTAVLLCATYSASTNTYGVSGIDMLITDRPLTWATAGSAAALANSELPYVLGSISFGTNSTGNGREWNVFGNAMSCSQVGQSIGIRPATNSIFLYFKCRAAMTNAANDSIKLTISQD